MFFQSFKSKDPSMTKAEQKALLLKNNTVVKYSGHTLYNSDKEVIRMPGFFVSK